MITQIQNVPANMVAFRAEGEVTKDDFDMVREQVAELVRNNGKLNYLLYLDTPVKDFTAGAWLQDALLGIENITKWNRAAIISDSEGVKNFTDAFSKVMPGEFKGFEKSRYNDAVAWVSEQVESVN
ncbi:MAG: STAS/SEC14 domain-containing protein [Flavobacterium sp.]